MAIVVETGAIVTGANSYVSRADVITYAASRGVTLADSAATDAMLVKACDYMESMRARYKGELVERDQPLAWPRSGVELEGWSWSSDEIPRQVIAAQCALVLEINAGEDPFNPSRITGPIVQESISGAVTVAYASATSSKVSKTQASSTLINLLLSRSGLLAVRS